MCERVSFRRESLEGRGRFPRERFQGEREAICQGIWSKISSAQTINLLNPKNPVSTECFISGLLSTLCSTAQLPDDFTTFSTDDV